MRRYLITIVTLFLVISCGQAGEKKEAASQNKREGVFGAYLDLRDSFFNSRPAGVKAASEKLRQEIGKTTVPEAFGQKDWTAESAKLIVSLGQIEASNNIEEQRKFFADFSERFYNDLKQFRLASGKVYLEHCPMAFDGKGADWVSDSKKIHNPYFGEDMPECGEVKEEKKL
jgi:Cu(I)/Ag(I) efflux system membrane fusion protein